MAEFERVLIIERTQAGLSRAKAEGKTLSRRPSLSEKQAEAVLARLESGESIAGVAKDFDTNHLTILRVGEA